MLTYQEFITEAKAPKAFQIGVQGNLDQQVQGWTDGLRLVEYDIATGEEVK